MPEPVTSEAASAPREMTRDELVATLLGVLLGMEVIAPFSAWHAAGFRMMLDLLRQERRRIETGVPQNVLDRARDLETMMRAVMTLLPAPPRKDVPCQHP